MTTRRGFLAALLAAPVLAEAACVPEPTATPAGATPPYHLEPLPGPVVDYGSITFPHRVEALVTYHDRLYVGLANGEVRCIDVIDGREARA